MDKKYINDYNNLIKAMADDIKDVFMVLGFEREEIVFKNKRAVNYNEEFPMLMKYITKTLFEKMDSQESDFELVCENSEGNNLIYNVNCYNIFWDEKPAKAFRLCSSEEYNKDEQGFRDTLFLDEQTGLYNRRYCFKRINELLANNERFIVSFIDMDNLNYVNKNFGYTEGDKYIKSLVNVFSDTFRKTDAVCRIGGDEFIVIMPNCPEELAEIRISETREKMDQINCAYKMSFSYGNILVEKDTTLSREAILKMADQKMYEFKRQNREPK